MSREWDFRVSKSQLRTLCMTAEEYAQSRFADASHAVTLLESDDLYEYIVVTPVVEVDGPDLDT